MVKNRQYPKARQTKTLEHNLLLEDDVQEPADFKLYFTVLVTFL